MNSIQQIYDERGRILENHRNSLISYSFFSKEYEEKSIEDIIVELKEEKNEVKKEFLKELVIYRNLKLIFKFVSKEFGKLKNLYIDYTEFDLIQICIIVMLKEIENFDIKEGCKFSTFIYLRLFRGIKVISNRYYSGVTNFYEQGKIKKIISFIYSEFESNIKSGEIITKEDILNSSIFESGIVGMGTNNFKNGLLIETALGKIYGNNYSTDGNYENEELVGIEDFNDSKIKNDLRKEILDKYLFDIKNKYRLIYILYISEGITERIKDYIDILLLKKEITKKEHTYIMKIEGTQTLESLGKIFGLTRERIRQICRSSENDMLYFFNNMIEKDFGISSEDLL